MTVPALGFCVCGYASWVLTDGVPNHPCCAGLGPNCEPCRISRDEHRKHTPKRKRTAA